MSVSFVILWPVAHQAPLSMGFPRQEHWSGLPFPSLRNLPHSGIEPASPVSPALTGGFFTTVPPWNPICGSWPCCLVTVTSDSSATPWAVATRLLCPWDFPGKNTGVGYHFLLQGIYLTQGLKPGLVHCRQTLYLLSHQGSPSQYNLISK